MTVLAAMAVGCGSERPADPGPAGPGIPGKGAGGAAGPGKGMPGPAGPGKTGMGGSAVIVVGIPTSTSTGTSFPGGGPNGSAPLAAGCTPASARECPSSSGVCATSSSSHPTGTTSGSICFYGTPTATTTTTTKGGALPAATIEYLHETGSGQEYYRFRITFDPAFVDNTYGTNAIGWGQKGHTFKDLVGSDHAELSLFDGAKTMVSMFDLDYITANTGSSCGYGALGVSGGEGKMLLGDSKYILASTTSLDRDLNGCGYCANAACGGNCTVNSPSTDAIYSVNASAPLWDYRVVYEVWVDGAVFAGKSFGGASITFVHASPSKASSNTITVIPEPCCPPGQALYETESGPVCKPGGSCPTSTPVVGYKPSPSSEEGGPELIAASSEPEGGDGSDVTCICPTGTWLHGDLEFGHPTCEPVGPCPANYVQRTDSEGTTRCFPVPLDSTCPLGFAFVNDANGGRCI